MAGNTCTLTERGQISMPVELRRQLQLKPGQRLRWEVVSDTEMRLVVEAVHPDPLAALGFGPKFRKSPARRTADWMKELRAAE
ncbi:MAG: AbrB/MazE/SpoVT family DNA-binding domain-containing protein [Puniceicoccaceae bacterium]|nr:MAG: AbrB/MazE/SpoVT family DNA-binding domain-containing protein [Puniceicoccaceae bacterium]